MLRLGAYPEEERRITRDRLLENLRWLEEGSSKYVGASEESQRETTMVVHPMDDHFLLNYIDAKDAPNLLYEVCVRYTS